MKTKLTKEEQAIQAVKKGMTRLLASVRFGVPRTKLNALCTYLEVPVEIGRPRKGKK